MTTLNIRAHDLGVSGEENISAKLCKYGLDGIQLVAYKALPDIAYIPGSLSKDRALALGGYFKSKGIKIPLIGAYFNPVHPNRHKAENGIAVFKDYLSLARDLGSDTVGSETGSYNGDKWTYHPQNRTDEALSCVINTFGGLCDYADAFGVYVGMEGAFGHVCYDVKTLNRAVKAIDRKNIRIIFDLYNYLDASNIDKIYDILDEGLETFGDRIIVFHIKDCVICSDGNLKQCGVGKGIFDYGKILEKIKKVCPNANLVFEGTTGEDIEFAVNYIKERL